MRWVVASVLLSACASFELPPTTVAEPNVRINLLGRAAVVAVERDRRKTVVVGELLVATAEALYLLDDRGRGLRIPRLAIRGVRLRGQGVATLAPPPDLAPCGRICMVSLNVATGTTPPPTWEVSVLAVSARFPGGLPPGWEAKPWYKP